MKRILCIAVSFAVMAVFSFPALDFAYAADDQDGQQVEEQQMTEETIGEEVPGAVEEPAGEPVGEPADIVVKEDTDSDSSDLYVTFIDGCTIDDASVHLVWELRDSSTDKAAELGEGATVIYNIYQDDAKVREGLEVTELDVTGLTNYQKYTFDVEAVVTIGGETKSYKTSLASETNKKSVSKELKPLPEPTLDTLGTVSNLKWSHDYKSVNLEWTFEGNDDDISGYEIEVDGAPATLSNYSKDAPNKLGRTVKKIRVKGLDEIYGKTYDIQIRTYKKYKGKTYEGDWVKLSGVAPVLPLFVTFSPKQTGYAYTTAKGKKKGMKVTKGKTYAAKGFVCSRLRVHNSSKDKIYFFPRVKAKNLKMKYTTKFNYTAKEAENYVNHRGLKSTGKGKNRLVWISLYTQHVYFFKGSKGNWKLIDGWEVSTGKAQSATATGDWKIFRHWAKRRGLSYWSNFYSQVAMHSWGNPKCFGVPHSGGCVRMTKKQAKWVYNNMPFGTTVCVY